MKKMFVITSIKKDGLRHLSFANNHYNSYPTQEEAKKKLENVINNSSAETIDEYVGKDIEVTEVECYDSGDCARTIFPKKLI